MKKRYTRKQIMESIAYWKKQLKRMNESISPQNDDNILIEIFTGGYQNGEPTFILSNMKNIKEEMQKMTTEFFEYNIPDNEEEEEVYDLTDNTYKPVSQIDINSYIDVLVDRVTKNAVSIGDEINRNIYEDNCSIRTYNTALYIQIYIFPTNLCEIHQSFKTDFD